MTPIPVLKTLATACPQKQWELRFGGDGDGFTVSPKDEGPLGVIAENWPPTPHPSLDDVGRFIAVADPQTILALIARIEGLEKTMSAMRSRVVFYTDGVCHECGGEANYHSAGCIQGEVDSLLFGHARPGSHYAASAAAREEKTK